MRPGPARLSAAAAAALLLGVVSLHGAGGANPRTGRAFVLSGADGSLLLTLTAPDPNRGALFGHAVAGVGDVDGDGTPDLAVGAPGVAGGSSENVGRVYIFSGEDGSLIRALSPSAVNDGMRFGFSLAAAGDLDADGRGDLVVGAPKTRDPIRGKRAGAAFAISGAGGSVLHELYPDPNHVHVQGGMAFGWSVAAGTDVAGSDGTGEILVGAPGENVGAHANQGRAYLFDGASGSLISALQDPHHQSTALFGESVSFIPDASGDGEADLLIGADGASYYSGDFAGRVYVFSSADPNLPWLDRPAPLVEAFANFGFAVAGLADVDGDGRGDIAATSPESSALGADLGGIAYILSGDPNSSSFATLEDPDPHRLAFMGGSIAALPDPNGVALPEIAVGSEMHRDPNGVRAGRVYVFAAAGGAPHLTLESPTGDNCARFGWSVASAGDVDGDGVTDIIVGAPYHRADPHYVRSNCF